MRKIKVLEMIDRPFLGGGQKNLLSLVECLDRTRFEVAGCSQGNGPLVHSLRKKGLEHRAVPFSKKINGETIRKIVALLMTEHFDILHTHGGVAGFYGRWAARRCHVPVIIHTLHGIHYLHYRNPFLKHLFVLLERYFSRFTDALIFVSSADKRKGQKHRLAPEEKMYMIENGINFSGYSLNEDREGIGREFGITPHQPVVGTVARLHRQKGLSSFIQAAKKIIPFYPSLKVMIVGEGPQRQKLERLIQRLGLNHHVQLLGERKDAVRILSLFDVFVLPSLWEGLPYVLMEVGALGLPVVATDVTGITDIIRDEETGLLVPPRDSDILAEAVVRLLNDSSRRMRLGRNLRKSVVTRYPLSRTVQQTQALYQRLYERAQVEEG